MVAAVVAVIFFTILAMSDGESAETPVVFVHKLHKLHLRAKLR